MKCELCHKADAAKAIERMIDGKSEELYVCEACAKEDRRERLARKQSVKKKKRLLPPGVSISVVSAMLPPPPILEALVSAIESAATPHDAEPPKEKKAAKSELFPTERVDKLYRYGKYLQLEGLFLVGDLDAVKRSMEAMKMELEGVELGGVKDCGHVYLVKYSGSSEQAKRVVHDLITQERNARYHITEVESRTLGDTVARSLAMLKNCRLLSAGELFDMLSPLRIAAQHGFLEGISLKEINELLDGINVNELELPEAPADRYREDGARADEINALFEDVTLSDLGEEKIG